MSEIKLIDEPFVTCIAATEIDEAGMQHLANFIHDRHGVEDPQPSSHWMHLLPHDLHDIRWGEEFDHLRDAHRAVDAQELTGVELVPEISGRVCYQSFATLKAAGKKTNKDYLDHAYHKHKHKSISYHPSMTVFIGNVSRNLSHELIRHYVGCQRDEVGAPSQESTRYTHHDGSFVLPPAIVEPLLALEAIHDEGGLTPDEQQRLEELRRHRLVFIEQFQSSYNRYKWFLSVNRVKERKGLERKRLYETAREFLPGAAATSFVWTMNPESWTKMLLERADVSAHQEFRRLAHALARLLVAKFPNVFPPKMHAFANSTLEYDALS